MKTRSAAPHGVTLVELMIAMAITMVGMLGLMKLQVLALYSNQGARANTRAAQLARELATGIETLSPEDARLEPTAAASFGPLLSGTEAIQPAHEYDDANAIPGVRLNASIERDPLGGDVPIFGRRWGVRELAPGGVATGVRLVTVSIIWRERGLSQLREFVLFVPKPNPGAVLANAAAFR